MRAIFEQLEARLPLAGYPVTQLTDLQGSANFQDLALDDSGTHLTFWSNHDLEGVGTAQGIYRVNASGGGLTQVDPFAGLDQLHGFQGMLRANEHQYIALLADDLVSLEQDPETLQDVRVCSFRFESQGDWCEGVDLRSLVDDRQWSDEPQVFLFDKRDNSLTQLTKFQDSLGLRETLAVSRDGKQFAFVADQLRLSDPVDIDEPRGTYLLDTSTGNIELLSRSRADELSFSTDSRYVFGMPEGVYDIESRSFISLPDGLTSLQYVEQSGPPWLGFSNQDLADQNPDEMSQLFRWDPASGAIEQVTQLPATMQEPPDQGPLSYGWGHVSRALNDQRLAFSIFKSIPSPSGPSIGVTELVVYDTGNHEWVELLQMPHHLLDNPILQTVLSTDATQLFFVTKNDLTGNNPDGSYELFRVDLPADVQFPRPKLTRFSHASPTQLDDVALTYELAEESLPFDVAFYASSDAVFDPSTDTRLDFTLTVARDALESTHQAQLIGEPTTAALSVGTHTIVLDGFQSGIAPVFWEDTPHLFAVTEIGPQKVQGGPDQLIPYRGFYQNTVQTTNGVLHGVGQVRIGPAAKGTVTIGANHLVTMTYETESGEEGSFSATFLPSDVNVYGSDGDDFIHTSPHFPDRLSAWTGAGTNLVVGGPGDDWVYGGDGLDVILGEGWDIEPFAMRDLLGNLQAGILEWSIDGLIPVGAGRDHLDGGGGFDVIFGGPGDDILRAGEDGALIFGDGLHFPIASPRIDWSRYLSTIDFGTWGLLLQPAMELAAAGAQESDDSDSIYGGSGFDVILAGGGTDYVQSADTFNGDFADGGFDIVLAGPGDDFVDLREAEHAVVFGGDGDDVITSGYGASFLVGEAGSDVLAGGPGVDVLLGDSFKLGITDDWELALTTLAKAEFDIGVGLEPTGPDQSGNDVLIGGDSFDFLIGGWGDDHLEGGTGAGFLLGDAFTLTASIELDFADALGLPAAPAPTNPLSAGLAKLVQLASLPNFGYAGSGNDVLLGSTGLDVALGGEGDDVLYGNGGSVDVLFGNDGNDELRSGGYLTELSVAAGREDPDIFELWRLASFVRAGELIAHYTTDDTQFIVQIGGHGDDHLQATELPTANTLGSLLIGDTFEYLGLPVGSPADAIKIEIDNSLSSRFRIEGGLVQRGEGTDRLIGAQRGVNVMLGGGGQDHLTGGGFFDLMLGDSLDLGVDFVLDLSAIRLGHSLEENLEAIETLQIPLVSQIGDDDVLEAGEGGFMIAHGGPGADLIYSAPGFNVLIGGEGRDILFGHRRGSPGDDGFNLAFGDNVLPLATLFRIGREFYKVLPSELRGIPNAFREAMESHQSLTGESSVDRYWGGSGIDIVSGGPGDDVLFGGPGSDFLVGGLGDDYVDGQAGRDIVFGGPGNDELLGGPGDDYLESEEGDDTFRGGEGDDEIHGGDGQDHLYGDAGHDRLYGEAGEDFLIGGEGDDQLFGGEGNDVYFDSIGSNHFEDGPGVDTIVDTNQPPQARDDLARTYVETTVSLNVLANDTDADGQIDAKTLEVVQLPEQGEITIDPLTFEMVYEPNAGYIGVDTFTYHVRDNFGQVSNEATVSIAVGTPHLWQNWGHHSWSALDVNGNGSVEPLDVLLIFNALNDGGARLLSPNTMAFPPPYYDVNGDDFLSPLDALQVVNWLNEQSLAGEGEGRRLESGVR